jgi:uncharacterized protein YihD (DUF1040 family)
VKKGSDMKKSIILSAVAASLLVIGGCGSSSSKESSFVSNISGNVVDGPIKNAKVCVDYNFNGECDAKEPWAVTDENGSYKLTDVNLSKNAPILAVPDVNTVDTFTGDAFNKVLAAPCDESTVNINPITTVAAAKIYQLYKDGNLTSDAIESIKKEVAKAFGIDDDLTKLDIMKDSKLFAMAVAMAKLIDLNILNLEQKIDFDKLKDGNLTAAIKDPDIQSIMEKLLNAPDINTDSNIVLQQIQEAIENNQTDIDLSSLVNTTIENLITNNYLFKENDDGFYIKFNSDNTFEDVEVNDDTPKLYTGNWNLNEGVLELNYDSGFKAEVDSFNKISDYMYQVSGKDGSNKEFSDYVFLIPKEYVDENNLSKIAGFKSSDIDTSMISGKKVDDIEFYSDGSCVADNESSCSWNINNGVLEITTPDWSYDCILKDSDLLCLGKYEGYLNLKYITPNEIVPVTTQTVTQTGGFSQSDISDKTFAFNDDFIVFKDDGSWIRYEALTQKDYGTWQIDSDGNLVLHSNKDNINLVFSLVKNLGAVMEIYNPNVGNLYVAVLNTTNPLNVEVTSSDDLKALSSLVGKYPFTSEMIEGKTLKSLRFNKTYTFNSDHTFEIDGNAAGSWEIDTNGVLVLTFNNADVDKAYVVLGDVDSNEYKILVFDVKDNKLVEATPDIAQNSSIQYPLLEKLGTLFGLNWYKIDAFYPGDKRYEGNVVEIVNDSIKLEAFRKDGNDSRAQVVGMLGNASGFSAKVNLITDNIYSYFQARAESYRSVNTNGVISGLSSDSNLTLLAIFSIQRNAISASIELDDDAGNYVDREVKSVVYDYNLTDISDINDLILDISTSNNVVYYKVYKATDNSLIFNGEYNLSNLNISDFSGFSAAGFRSRVRDDKAKENNTTAISESLNYINDFQSK